MPGAESLDAGRDVGRSSRAARRDPLYAAFVLAIAMGLRRGEIVGLRWADVDLEKRVLLRPPADAAAARPVLYDDDPKGRRRRVVPLPAMCIAPLRWHRMRQADMQRNAPGSAWEDSGGYVFTTRTGRPVEPRNVYRSFTRVAAIRRPPGRSGCTTPGTAAPHSSRRPGSHLAS